MGREVEGRKEESHVIPLLLPMDLMKWFHEESIARRKRKQKEKQQ